eukprot:TRINITY_DN66983_c0_g2_i5.p1 TRINITY_DN66983_c0_g2~~TRINITY_DN66983_c0_g2_i5.p1  ORF type:complete len:356 (-),score=28.03 TRINITY_DN66983_c0_g2_i5:75-1142(-)
MATTKGTSPRQENPTDTQVSSRPPRSPVANISPSLSPPKGEMWTWGSGKFGRLGSGTKSDEHSPTKVKSLEGVNIVTVSAGTAHWIALDDAGNAYVCGANVCGQLGIPGREVTTPVKLPGDQQYMSVGCGYDHSVIVGCDQTVYVTGDNKHGQLGLKGKTGVKQFTPLTTGMLGIDEQIQDVTAGQYTTALITQHTRSLVLLGWKNGTTSPYGGPHTVMKGVKQVCLADRISEADGPKSGHVVGLLMDGTVVTWGRNEKGQLGRETQKNFDLEPLPVPTLSNVTQIASGGLHSAALLDDGSLFTWGCGSDGRLGSGDYDPLKHKWTFHHTLPEKVSANVVGVASSNFHMAAVVTG